MKKKDLEYELNELKERRNRIFVLFVFSHDDFSCAKYKQYLWDLDTQINLINRLIKTYFSEKNNPEQGEDKK